MVCCLLHPDFLSMLILCCLVSCAGLANTSWSFTVYGAALHRVLCLEAAVPLLCSVSPILLFVAFLPAITCLPLLNPPKQFAKELLVDANLPQACRTLCHGFKFNKKPSSLGLKMTSSSSQSNSCLASFWLPVAHTCMLQLCVLLKHCIDSRVANTWKT